MKRANPALPSLLVFAALIVGGFVSMAVAWRIAARTLDVSIQLPALISGGLGGLVLVIVGTALFVTQVGRLRAADERAHLDDVLDRTSEIVQAMRAARDPR